MTLSVKTGKDVADLYLDSLSGGHRFQPCPQADASMLPGKGRDRGPFAGDATAK